MQFYLIPEREDWFICDRKPIICPRCGKKEVRPSMFGMPSPEVWESGKWHIAGCMPDFPEHRTWGCRNCDAAFWKDTKHNLGRLDGVVHRDKEGKLRLGYPESITPEELPFLMHLLEE